MLRLQHERPMTSDVRDGYRHLRATPGVTAAALALGIGGSATLFSAVDAVALRHRPFAERHELVHDARAAMQVLASGLTADFPQTDRDRRITGRHVRRHRRVLSRGAAAAVAADSRRARAELRKHHRTENEVLFPRALEFERNLL